MVDTISRGFPSSERRQRTDTLCRWTPDVNLSQALRNKVPIYVTALPANTKCLVILV
jgi:hypothetical protein